MVNFHKSWLARNGPLVVESSNGEIKDLLNRIKGLSSAAVKYPSTLPVCQSLAKIKSHLEDKTKRLLPNKPVHQLLPKTKCLTLHNRTKCLKLNNSLNSNRLVVDNNNNNRHSYSLPNS